MTLTLVICQSRYVSMLVAAAVIHAAHVCLPLRPHLHSSSLLLVQDYVAVKVNDAAFLPHTAGRYQVKRFRKARVRLFGISPTPPAPLAAAAAPMQFVACFACICPYHYLHFPPPTQCTVPHC